MNVEATFPGAKRSGAGWMAKCPGHRDGTASLKIDVGTDGRILLKCFAGCETPAIVDAAGITMRDLMPVTSGAEGMVVTYDYKRPDGTLAYQVVRRPSKRFSQRRPDAAGGWIPNLQGITPLTYRLPELTDRVTVVVVEGEKDADRLWSLGIPATCNSGGAGKWKHIHTIQLRDAGVKNVAVIPDNDAPGRAHADTVAGTCAAAGLTAKIVTLTAGKDVSDFLDSGYAKDELLKLIETAVVHTPATPTPVAPAGLSLVCVGDLLDEPEESVDWLVDGLIPAGGIVVVAGKTTAMRHLSLALARGGNWLGRACEAGTVWYIALEGRRRDLRAHLRKLGARRGDRLHVFVGQAPAAVVAELIRLAQQDRPAAIVIDTLQRFLRAESTDDYAEMTKLFDIVIGLAQQSGASVILIHHAGKGE